MPPTRRRPSGVTPAERIKSLLWSDWPPGREVSDDLELVGSSDSMRSRTQSHPRSRRKAGS
jgi:hypothetical protein